MHLGHALHVELGQVLRTCVLSDLLDLALPDLLKNVIAPPRLDVEALVPLQGGHLLEDIVWQLHHLEVRLDAARRHALAQDNGAPLDAPRENELGRIETLLTSQLLHSGVVHHLGLASLVVAQWRVRLDQDVL